MRSEGVIKINPDASFMLFPFSPDIISSRIKETLTSDKDEVNQIIDYIVQNNGKMIRPRLVILSSSFFAAEKNMVRDVAVAVELIHLASLVHDDIIDRSLLRRGKQSLNAIWGNQVSVLVGDYLFAAAFKLINQYGLKDILDTVTDTIRIMCTGEIKQMSLAYDVNITEDDYLDKTFGKTACLFAASCKVGALASSMPEPEIHHVEEFGLSLGYAYQIMDDVLDFLSDASVLGKPVANDLVQGNITLPVIFALRTADTDHWLKDTIQERKLHKGNLKKINRILNECGAIEYAVNRSRQFLANGLDNLHKLPPGLARNMLEELSWYLMNDYFSKLQWVQNSGKEAAE
jgi:heptaprenyl diphosphate synthase